MNAAASRSHEIPCSYMRAMMWLVGTLATIGVPAMLAGVALWYKTNNNVLRLQEQMGTVKQLLQEVRQEQKDNRLAGLFPLDTEGTN